MVGFYKPEDKEEHKTSKKLKVNTGFKAPSDDNVNTVSKLKTNTGFRKPEDSGSGPAINRGAGDELGGSSTVVHSGIKVAKPALNCECCGQVKASLRPFGKTKICKDCFSTITNTGVWKQNKYEDNLDVENNRRILLDIARMHNFSSAVVDEINAYFDGKLQKDLVCIIDGGMGQKLKVYEKHCKLITEGTFNPEMAAKKYAAVLKKSHPMDGIVTNANVKTFAQNVFKGGIVLAGLNLATSAAINVAADKVMPTKGAFKKVKNNFKIDYTIYDYAEIQGCDEKHIGYIRFVNGKTGGKQEDDVLFFFTYNDVRIEEAYKAIDKGMYDVRHSYLEKTVEGISAADEILKFKNLLDMGLITSEEFEIKRKELLNIK